VYLFGYIIWLNWSKR